MIAEEVLERLPLAYPEKSLPFEHQWYWINDAGMEVPFVWNQNLTIEREFVQKSKVAYLEGKFTNCAILFTTGECTITKKPYAAIMNMSNVATKRGILRKPAAAKIAEANLLGFDDDMPQNVALKSFIIGFKECVDKAKPEFEKMVQGLFETVQQACTLPEAKILSIQGNNKYVSIVSNKNGQITLHGLKSDVAKALKDVQTAINDEQHLHAFFAKSPVSAKPSEQQQEFNLLEFD